MPLQTLATFGKLDMSEPATLTVRLFGRTNDQLDELAGRTRRPRGALAEEAIAAYVERELADVREGRVVPYEEVVREARAIVAAARAER